MIERFGLLVVTMHAQAINELINSGDKDEFGKQKAFIDPAFDLYTVLNKKYCIGSSDRETVEKVFSQAKDAYYAQNYGEAVELFRQVIKMDSAYASQNGCYWHIGKCYREWKKYNEAESAFKDSIRHDQTKPYKRQAFYDGLRLFLFTMPTGEQSYLGAVDYLKDVYGFAPDPYILQSVWYEIGHIYVEQLAKLSTNTAAKREEYLLKAVEAYKYKDENFPGTPDPDLENHKLPGSGIYYAGDTYGQLAVISGLSNEKKADYYKKAIAEFQRVIDDYPGSSYAPSAYNSAGNACQTVPQMLTDKQEKIVFFERAIDYFKTLREKYYTFWASEGALLSMGSCHMKIGYGVHYTDYASQISAMEFGRENLEAAAALFRRFIGEYPGSSSVPTCRNFLGEALRNLADSFWTSEESTSGITAYDESIAEFGTVAGDQSILYPYRISALEQIAVCGIRTARIYR
ncbi:MAG: tetratricopeptide repeat protein, partial [Candidatus Wallbacteria bacterium]|nr:tetratricopeptide repeat protein [Candidatus Wallbacteria bacterium]